MQDCQLLSEIPVGQGAMTSSLSQIEPTVTQSEALNSEGVASIDSSHRPHPGRFGLSPLMAAVLEGLPEAAGIVVSAEVLTLPPYVRGVTTASVSWLDRTGRGLLLARPDTADVVIMSEAAFDRSLTQWLYEKGLGASEAQIIQIPQRFIQPNLAGALLKHPHLLTRVAMAAPDRAMLLPFFNSQLEQRLSQALGDLRLFGPDPQIRQMLGDKGQFKLFCQQLNIPTVPGRIFQFCSRETRWILESIICQLFTEYGGVIIRGTDGTGGSSIIKVTCQDAIAPAMTEVERQAAEGEPAFLVEPLLPVVASPNLQWAIGDEGFYYLGLNDQLFGSMLAHAGNVGGDIFAPHQVEAMMAQGDRIVAAMQRRGYRGVVGIDFIVLEAMASFGGTPGNLIFPIEANTRLNGSTFTYEVLHRAFPGNLDAIFWKSLKLNVAVKNFSELQTQFGSLLYTADRLNLPTIIVTECIPGKQTCQVQVLLAALSAADLRDLEQVIVLMNES